VQYNILHLIPLFEIGGLQRQIANWVAYDPTGNRHFLGILNHSTEGFVLIKKEITVLFNDNCQSPDNLIKSLVKHRVQIIVAHNRAAWDKAATIIKELPFCRLFFVAHGRELKFHNEDQSAFLGRLRHNLTVTEKVICTSSFLESMVSGFVPEARSKIARVYNGVIAPALDGTMTQRRAKEALGIPADRFLAGTVTRLAGDKNLDFLIRAVGLLVKHGRKDVLLLILGNGKDKALLRDRIKECKVDNFVRLESANEDVGAYYRAFDLYVNCSVFESCSMAILEAMSHGLPVLAPLVGGNGELVVDGECGFLYPFDDLGAFVESFELLYRDSHLRGRLGSGARQYVLENFGLEKMVRDYERIFHPN
jgi:glycosyltransferase involved in cell wall biosynthesis